MNNLYSDDIKKIRIRAVMRLLFKCSSWEIESFGYTREEIKLAKEWINNWERARSKKYGK